MCTILLLLCLHLEIYSYCSFLELKICRPLHLPRVILLPLLLPPPAMCVCAHRYAHTHTWKPENSFPNIPASSYISGDFPRLPECFYFSIAFLWICRSLAKSLSNSSRSQGEDGRTASEAHCYELDHVSPKIHRLKS